jgi:hypothetical protein
MRSLEVQTPMTQVNTTRSTQVSCNLLFYAINIDSVSLFEKSLFLFLAILNLYCMNVFYQFGSMDIVYLIKKDG